MSGADARGVRRVSGESRSPVGERWAIVVGISRYAHAGLNLAYADRDASAFCELLKTPAGGAFKEEHVQLLLNEDATTANLTRALRGFLKKPARDDLVIIYLACHGAPDPDRPENVYLLTHDTDPDEIGGTGVPMEDVDRSLRNNLLAEKVVIIADTCHSAAIGGGMGRRSAPNANQVVNEYLNALGEAKAGVALLTSAEASQSSLEDVKWGGGHGVFTHYLLEGMRGAADTQPTDGKVTVGELFEYVRDKVKEETGHRQHPTIGTSPFDRNLPIAVPGINTAARLNAEAEELLKSGDEDGALERWREARRVYPEHEPALRGIAQIESARAEAARKRAEKAAQRQRALDRQHRKLLELNRTGELETDLCDECEELLDRDPETLDAHERQILEFIARLVDGKTRPSVFVRKVGLLLAERAGRVSGGVAAPKEAEERGAPEQVSGAQGDESASRSDSVPARTKPVASTAARAEEASKESVGAQVADVPPEPRASEPKQAPRPKPQQPPPAEASAKPKPPGTRRSNPGRRIAIGVGGVIVAGVAAVAALNIKGDDPAAALVPPTASLEAQPVSIERGASVALSWETENATEVTLIPDGQTVQPAGSTLVTPDATTWYRLIARGDEETARDSVRVIVTEPPPDRPSGTLVARPTRITSGGSATLEWETSNATEVSLTPGPGSVGLRGERTVTPTSTVTYRLTARGDGGEIERTVRVTVERPPPPAVTVAEVQVAPVTLQLTQGDRRTILATAYDSRGNPMVTAPLVWSVDDAEVATVEFDPSVPSVVTVRAVGPGATVVRARAGDVQGATSILVSSPAGVAPGDSLRDCGTCPVMVVIPAGTYMMGSPESERGRDSDEGPQHEVTIAQFALGRYEVTVGEYAAYARANGVTPRAPSSAQTDDHPVVNVSWEEAKAYVEWLSETTGEVYRLPSEAEWEYAARAGTETARYWGVNPEDACRYANVADSTAVEANSTWTIHPCRGGFAETAPVGRLEASAFGLTDMLGNVWEWVADCWNASYRGAPSDGSAWASDDCSRRVLRGGSFVSNPTYVRSASRSRDVTTNRNYLHGFRVARTLP